jgi:thiol-disulfide isomerase/thioredoxin
MHILTGEEVMKAKSMLLLLCGILVWGCEKKESEAQKEEFETPKQEIGTKDTETSQKEPVMAKKGPEAPPKEESRIETPAAAIPTKIGDRAFVLTGLEWVKGEPVTFEAGSIYVVEFWATWCPPCRTSIPHLTEIQHKYKDQKLTVIGISTETAAKVKPFVEEWGAKMDYTVAIDPERKVHKGYMKAFKQNGIPHAFIVDGEGKLAWHGHPMADMDTVLPQVISGAFDMAAYAQKKAKQEQVVKNLRSYFAAIQSGETNPAVQDLARQILSDGSTETLNELAWNILTKVPKEKRDLALALQAAEKANTMTEGKSAMILDTYALALFENGQVQAAIENQTKAVELSKDNERMVGGMRKQLEKFQASVE